MNFPYIVRDVYSRNEFKEIKDNQRLTLNTFSKFSQTKEFEKFFDENKIVINNEDYDFKLVIKFDINIKKDGYRLNVKSQENKIIIAASNERGIVFAINTLNELIEIKDNSVKIPIILIEDYPSFKMRGIIEGFYGVPWSHENRLDVIDFIRKYKMNTFMYAPKDDIYHRGKWRELYPEKELNQLLEYKTKCDENYLDFYYCISPGNDFEYTQQADFEKLFAKLDQIIVHGVNKFALLMDDIDYDLKSANKNQFKRPGIAHAAISNEINKYLKGKVIDLEFIMCPTEYFQNWDSLYRNDLKKYLDKDIQVFWTGYNTIPEVINEDDCKIVQESFGHDLVLWENYPVNDFCTNRLFLGPLVNRSSKLPNYHVGMVANPMNQWNASKIGVITMAHYMWNSEKYDPNKSLELAICDNIESHLYDHLAQFVNINRSSVLEAGNAFIHKKWIENNDKEAINKYYVENLQVVNNLKKSNNIELINDFKPLFERFEIEYNLWNLIYENKSISGDELKSLENTSFVLGDNIIVDYLIKYEIVKDYDYNKIKTKVRDVYWTL